jgi:hypothetical protein
MKSRVNCMLPSEWLLMLLSMLLELEMGDKIVKRGV